MSITWTITYRFYDDNAHKNKQVRRQGMNEFKDLRERRDCTQAIINAEIRQLESGYNPISDIYTEENTEGIVGPKTKFVEALKMVQLSLKLTGFTKNDMAVVVDNVSAAAPKVQIDGERLDGIKIYDIKKRHIRALMNNLAAANNWSAHAWNKYRSYLMMLFKELGEYDAVESNIPREISKRKTVKKVRVVLSPEERKKVKAELQDKNRRFWLFINMFFHSGSRIAEFFRIKLSDIDIEKQTLKITVKKGRQYIEVIKPIKDIAIPYWEEYIKGYTDKNLFLMGEGLFPAGKAIRYDQINHRWQRVKAKLKIEADFYSLKHLNTDEVSAKIGIERAMKLNSHTSINTTKIYAINENVREMELIKKVENEF